MGIVMKFPLTQNCPILPQSVRLGTLPHASKTRGSGFAAGQSTLAADAKYLACIHKPLRTAGDTKQ
jgi:hypothetical protein